MGTGVYFLFFFLLRSNQTSKTKQSFFFFFGQSHERGSKEIAIISFLLLTPFTITSLALEKVSPNLECKQGIFWAMFAEVQHMASHTVVPT